MPRPNGSSGWSGSEPALRSKDPSEMLDWPPILNWLVPQPTSESNVPIRSRSRDGCIVE